jgi:hypothetical protein
MHATEASIRIARSWAARADWCLSVRDSREKAAGERQRVSPSSRTSALEPDSDPLLPAESPEVLGEVPESGSW